MYWSQDVSYISLQKENNNKKYSTNISKINAQKENKGQIIRNNIMKWDILY